MAPTIAVGTSNSGTTGATTYVWPSHQADDLLFIAIESSGTALSTPSTPSGMAHTAASPRSQSSNTTVITVFWKRATSSSEADVIVPAAADHQVGIPFRVRGGLTSGNPWSASSSTGQSSNSGTRTFSGFTTVTADTLVVYMLATETDTTTDTFGTLTAPSGVTGFTVLDRLFTDSGGGGGVLVAYGTKATAGFAGSLTWTFASAGVWSGIVLSLDPALAVTEFEGWGVSL